MRWTWWAAGVATAGVAVALLVVFSVGSGSKGTTAGTPVRAPDVLLASADQRFHLSDLRGRPVLLYFSFPG